MLAVCHTYYSLQTGVRSAADWAKAAVERGYSALALADINGLYGAVEFYKSVLSAGLKPIIGVQLQMAPDISCIILATSDRGYRQLCRLLSARHLYPRFVLEEALERSGYDGLLLLTHSPAVRQRLAGIVSVDRVYLLPGARSVKQRVRTLWDAVPSAGHELAIPDAWLIAEEDWVTFTELKTLREKAGRYDEVCTEHPGLVLPDAADWRRKHPESTAVAAEVCERCNFRFTFNQPKLPHIVLPAGRTAPAYLRQLCTDSLEQTYSGSRKHVAQTRLDKELAVICDSGFADYFLYVNEIIGFAHQRQIPVEVRGSAASSIVSYLLGFTHCCPLEHDLYFERFMNPGRRDCPDIDIDIADNRRDEVVKFCYDRWGEDRVAMVATVLTYRSRSALRDAARIHGYSSTAVSQFLAGGQSRAMPTQLVETAGRLIGLPRHLGVHCGGLIITPGPLTDMTPLTRSRNGLTISHYEKDQAETIGLVKMDLLGNSALSVIDESIVSLKGRGQSLDEPGPCFDYKVNRLFAVGDTLGVYQCESPGMRQLCRALSPRTPKEVSITLSLIRPGPAAAGMKETFIRRRRGVESITYLHPRMASFLSTTYGVMLYQEDVMKVAVNLAGYSLADADHLRRAVKKRDGQVFREERSRFVFQKAASVGVDTAVANEMWHQVTRFASYSYCKAHASVYGRLAWLTARLKAHFPRDFYAAVLNCHKSMYPKRVFVWDAIRHGVPVFPPDVNKSVLKWRPVRHGIRAGLTVISGLRYDCCLKLMEESRRRSFTDLRDLRKRVEFHAGELERLIVVGACRSLGPRESLMKELQETGDRSRQQALLPVDDIQLPSQLQAELSFTAIPFSRHPVPFDSIPSQCMASQMKHYVNHEVEMVGLLDAVKHTTTEGPEAGKKRRMSFVTLEDVTGLFELVLFPDMHERYGHCFNHLGPYRVRGIVSEQWGSCVLEVTKVVDRIEKHGVDLSVGRLFCSAMRSL
ncbi:MAG: PHP domain-containing protein [Candidatus Pacebacteria bacterium]|nr:PHP domain-containing protein [Candidatus Paceibacterota bacterium]